MVSPSTIRVIAGLSKTHIRLSPVESEHPVEHSLAGRVNAAMFLLVLVLEKVGAHHRRGGQGDDHRDQDGGRKGHGELAEQPADDASHHEERNKDRDERDADGEDGEADFLGALERGANGAMPASRWRVTFSMTTMASSTTKPVEMVSAIRERLSMLYPQRYMIAQGAEQRNRNGDAGDEGGAAIAQEHEDDQDDENDGNARAFARRR